MLLALKKTKEILLDILFPPVCLICQKSLEYTEKEKALCVNCFSNIPIAQTLTCPVCGARLAQNKKICHEYSSYRLAAAATYNNETVKELIWQLKYHRKTAAARPSAEILKTHLKNLELNISNYHILAVPLHKNRERERGFNQSELIADELAKKISLPLIKNGLLRIKDTEPQAETKDFEARKSNMKDSFFVNQPQLIKAKNIILIDDVFTSGATLTEAVKTLRAAGSGKIIALVLAKAGF